MSDDVVVLVKNDFERNTTEYAISKSFDNFAALVKCSEIDTVERTAIEFVNDTVVRDVDQTTSEVTGISRFKSRIRETFSSTMRRSKVFENGQTFTEVSGNRGFDDRAGRLGHQTTHTGELTHLLCRTSSSRVGHDEDSVKRLRNNFL